MVDEGQDFADGWLLSLESLLFDGREDVLYVFHDPAQALFREDAVAGLAMPEFVVAMNCRNAQPIHALIQRFAGEGLSANAMRQDGRRPELIEADGPKATAKALRLVLHRLRVDEGVKPWDIAVLTGTRLEDSAIWHVPGRQFEGRPPADRLRPQTGRSPTPRP